jgi:hypothetical protein
MFVRERLSERAARCVVVDAALDGNIEAVTNIAGGAAAALAAGKEDQIAVGGLTIERALGDGDQLAPFTHAPWTEKRLDVDIL